MDGSWHFSQWLNRCQTDERTLGGLYYHLCDQVNELDWAVELQQLIELLQDVLKKTNKQTQQLLLYYCNIREKISYFFISFLVCDPRWQFHEISFILKVRGYAAF
jgi:hypothetical protein